MLRSLHRASSVGAGLNKRWNERDRKEIGKRSKEGLRGRIVCEERLERVPGCHARTGTASTIVVGESYRFVIQAAKRTR